MVCVSLAKCWRFLYVATEGPFVCLSLLVCTAVCSDQSQSSLGLRLYKYCHSHTCSNKRMIDAARKRWWCTSQHVYNFESRIREPRSKVHTGADCKGLLLFFTLFNFFDALLCSKSQTFSSSAFPGHAQIVNPVLRAKSAVFLSAVPCPHSFSWSPASSGKESNEALDYML